LQPAIINGPSECCTPVNKGAESNSTNVKGTPNNGDVYSTSKMSMKTRIKTRLISLQDSTPTIRDKEKKAQENE